METSETVLWDVGEVISDPLLIAMVLQGSPSKYNMFVMVIMQREKQMTFIKFKSMLRSHEENIMVTKVCGRSKMEKWCNICKKSHSMKSCLKKKDVAKTTTEKTTSSEHTFAIMSKDKYRESGMPT